MVSGRSKKADTNSRSTAFRFARLTSVSTTRPSTWWRIRQERADLHRGGVGAQQPPVRKIERVGHGARRMVGRDVERGEVVEVVLDLRPLRHLAARTAEDRLDPQPGARHGMERTACGPASRQRDVEPAGGERALDPLPFEPLAATGGGGGGRVARRAE